MEQQVLDALKQAGKPLKAGEISAITGLTAKEVDKAMKSLKEMQAIVSPKRCYWEAR